jgi:hypothetical protein
MTDLDRKAYMREYMRAKRKSAKAEAGGDVNTKANVSANEVNFVNGAALTDDALRRVVREEIENILTPVLERLKAVAPEPVLESKQADVNKPARPQALLDVERRKRPVTTARIDRQKRRMADWLRDHSPCTKSAFTNHFKCLDADLRKLAYAALLADGVAVERTVEEGPRGYRTTVVGFASHIH